MNSDRTATTTDLELLEMRLAARVSALLAEPANQVSPDVAERLRFAREQAVARARAVRTASGSVTVGSAGGTVVLGSSDGWWSRLGIVMPVVALVLGMLVVSHWNSRERSFAAAEIDAALLSDQLPPAAYTDPGFVAFLKLAQP